MATVPNNNTFASNGGGAAFGNPNLSRQGQAALATQGIPQNFGVVDSSNWGPEKPPPNASASPAATSAVYASLVDALNQNQAKLVKDGKQEIADVYVIEFSPPDLAASALKQPGAVNSDNTAMQNPNTAASILNPSQNSINYNTQGWQVIAGTSIIQLIDQVMRSSTYITNQQSIIVSDDGASCTANPASTNSTAWYKISLEATQLAYDHIRHDFAYRMRYVISPYAINQAASQYFPDSKYRGSHKSYNYWFTGLNSDILHFEQEYNNLYRLVISGIGAQVQKKITTDFRDQRRRTYLPTSAEQTQGGNNSYQTEPGANLADFLYSPSDQAKCHMRIIGDPAWMQQNEVGPGIGAVANFNFEPFNSDGGINYDSQQIVFDISWNRPADYNFATGITDITTNRYGEPLENVSYTAIQCKSIFSKGRFEQEIEGRALIEFDKAAPNQIASADNGRPQAGTTDSQTSLTSTAIIGNSVVNNSSISGLSRQVNSLSPTAGTFITSLQKFQNSNPAPNSTSQIASSNPGTQPAAPPAPPTSNGDVDSTNGDTPQDQTVGQNTTDTSQPIAQDDA